MTRLVVDASVTVKWLFPEREGETDTAAALAILRGVRDGRVRLFQPPHWLAETLAVCARLAPETAEEDAEDLLELVCTTVGHPAVYLTACRLAVVLGHHLFDTLYHAAALETPGALLVTADERYALKAHAHGGLVRLADAPLTW